MDDFELFRAMNEEFDELRDEFRKRGLHKRPFVEWSHFENPATEPAERRQDGMAG